MRLRRSSAQVAISIGIGGFPDYVSVEVGCAVVPHRPALAQGVLVCRQFWIGREAVNEGADFVQPNHSAMLADAPAAGKPRVRRRSGRLRQVHCADIDMAMGVGFWRAGEGNGVLERHQRPRHHLHRASAVEPPQ